MTILRLKQNRLRAGDTLEANLLHYTGPVESLQLKLINNHGTYPQQGLPWRFESIVGDIFARIVIPKEPLHNPDAGEYQLSVLDSDGSVVAATRLYISHWQKDQYYGVLELLPKPQHCFYAGLGVKIPLSQPLFLVRDKDADRADRLTDFLENVLQLGCGNDVDNAGSVQLIINPDDSPLQDQSLSEHRRSELETRPESYRISCDYSSQPYIKLWATDELGLFQGLRTIAQMVKIRGCNYCLPELEIIDWPDFRYRGIVEGFYGEPWSTSTRFKVLGRLSQLKHNMYFYAPKDDPYHREKWSDPYDATALRELQQLLDHCNCLHLKFVYSISPGLSICYSSNSDRQTLLAKLRSIIALGVTQVALLFDDIDEQLPHDRDVVQYGHPAAAQADLCNWLHLQLHSGSAALTMIFCPTEYYQQTDSSYRKTLREQLHPDISCLWTGTGIFSRSIPVANALQHRDWFGRNLWLWDNYPVNDADKSSLMMGPLTNRDASLSSACEALLSNPMPQGNLSCISLGTCADYGWNSRGYDPDRSWRASINCFSENSAYQRLAGACTGSRIHAPLPTKLSSLWDEFNSKSTAQTKLSLQQELNCDSVAIDSLLGEPDAEVLAELTPFLSAWRAQLQRVQDLLGGEHSATEAIALETAPGCPYDGLLQI